MNMISIKNVWKSYNGNAVLKGVNLSITQGKTFVILGRSGCGKSVLLRQMMGIEKPDRGEIEIAGYAIAHLRGNQLYNAVKGMGMLFQAAALFDSMTVEENVGFYLRQHKDPILGRFLNAEEISDRVKEALGMVGLQGTEGKMPSDLSGGMRKRAALARLIVYKPKILLYDEPTTGLDPITAMQINDLILRVQATLDATSIVVTHDLCSTIHVANLIGVMHEGQIIHLFSKEEFLNSDDPIVKTFLNNSIPEGISRE